MNNAIFQVSPGLVNPYPAIILKVLVVRRQNTAYLPTRWGYWAVRRHRGSFLHTKSTLTTRFYLHRLVENAALVEEGGGDVEAEFFVEADYLLLGVDHNAAAAQLFPANANGR